MVYLRYQMTRTPSLANPIIQTTPPGTPFLAPLQADEERGIVEVEYLSIESVLGEQVGHNFSYW